MSKVPAAMKDYPLPKDFLFRCPFQQCPYRPQKSYSAFLSHLSSCNRAKGTTVYHCIYFFGHIFASKADRDHHELACPFLYYGPRYVRENTELKIDSNQKTLFSGENEPLPPQGDLGLVDKKPTKEEKRTEIIKTFMYITMHFDDNDIQNSIQNNPTQEIFELNSKAFPLKTVLMVILCCKLGTNLKPERLEIESVVPVTEIDKQLRERKYEFKAKIACFTELDISDNATHAARLRKHLTTNVGIIKRPQENEVGIIMSSDSELISDSVNHQLPFKKANVFYLCVVPYAQYADVAILRSEPSYFFEERDLAELTKKMKMINLNSGDRQQSAGSESSDKLQKEIREIQEKMRKEEREIKERANPLDEQIERLEREVAHYRTVIYNLKKEEIHLKEKENTETTQRQIAENWLKAKEKEIQEQIKEGIIPLREDLGLKQNEEKVLEDSRKGREDKRKEVRKIEAENEEITRAIEALEKEHSKVLKTKEKPNYIKGN